MEKHATQAFRATNLKTTDFNDNSIVTRYNSWVLVPENIENKRIV
jgi:hypothetical protein